MRCSNRSQDRGKFETLERPTVRGRDDEENFGKGEMGEAVGT